MEYCEKIKANNGNLDMLNETSRIEKAKRIVETLKVFKIKQSSCLDLGCSIGVITRELKKHFDKVVGIDTDKEAVNGKDCMYGSALDIPFPDKTFDIVVCNHVYEHVEDQHKLFNEIYRVLKYGGVCYLSAVNKFVLREPHYKKILGQFSKDYEENMLYYWQIKTLLRRFRVMDYSCEFINKYYFRLPKLVYKILKIFNPTYIFILRK